MSTYLVETTNCEIPHYVTFSVLGPNVLAIYKAMLNTRKINQLSRGTNKLQWSRLIPSKSA